MALLVPKKQVSAHTRYPDAYYKSIYFDKQMFDGIELVAKVERLTKKKAARLLMEEGFRNYISKGLHEYIKDDIADNKLRQRRAIAPFIRELRRFAKERGVDIFKFI
jgi:hypothetical protein